MINRPDILLLEGTEETVALGTGSALSVLVIPYQDAGVDYRPQLNDAEDAERMHLQMSALRMPGIRLADLASVHRSIDRVTATLSSWRYAENPAPKEAENPDPEKDAAWGWHRVGLAPRGRKLYSLNHGDGNAWLLGSCNPLRRAYLLHKAAGRCVNQMVCSRPSGIESLAIGETDLSALERDLRRDGVELTSWLWHPDADHNEVQEP